jgi:hypothetical protein
MGVRRWPGTRNPKNRIASSLRSHDDELKSMGYYPPREGSGPAGMQVFTPLPCTGTGWYDSMRSDLTRREQTKTP